MQEPSSGHPAVDRRNPFPFFLTKFYLKNISELRQSLFFFAPLLSLFCLRMGSRSFTGAKNKEGAEEGLNTAATTGRISQQVATSQANNHRTS